MNRTHDARTEVETLRRCQGHRNIVQLLEVMHDDAYTYMIMELLHGGELLERVNLRSFDEEGISNIFKQILHAVDYMHGLGIAHCDLKPENILFVAAGSSELKIIDFGFAQHYRRGTGMRNPWFTLDYAAPEMLPAVRMNGHSKSAVAYTPACDMWSIGVILYAMMCGHAPFPATTTTTTDDSHAYKQNAIAADIRVGRYNRTSARFQYLNGTMKQLIDGLICVDVAQRLTTNTIFNGIWLGKSAATVETIDLEGGDDDDDDDEEVDEDVDDEDDDQKSIMSVSTTVHETVDTKQDGKDEEQDEEEVEESVTSELGRSNSSCGIVTEDNERSFSAMTSTSDCAMIDDELLNNNDKFVELPAEKTEILLNGNSKYDNDDADKTLTKNNEVIDISSSRSCSSTDTITYQEQLNETEILELPIEPETIIVVENETDENNEQIYPETITTICEDEVTKIVKSEGEQEVEPDILPTSSQSDEDLVGFGKEDPASNYYSKDFAFSAWYRSIFCYNERLLQRIVQLRRPIEIASYQTPNAPRKSCIISRFTTKISKDWPTPTPTKSRNNILYTKLPQTEIKRKNGQATRKRQTIAATTSTAAVTSFVDVVDENINGESSSSKRYRRSIFLVPTITNKILQDQIIKSDSLDQSKRARKSKLKPVLTAVNSTTSHRRTLKRNSLAAIAAAESKKIAAANTIKPNRLTPDEICDTNVTTTTASPPTRNRKRKIDDTLVPAPSTQPTTTWLLPTTILPVINNTNKKLTKKTLIASPTTKRRTRSFAVFKSSPPILPPPTASTINATQPPQNTEINSTVLQISPPRKRSSSTRPSLKPATTTPAIIPLLIKRPKWLDEIAEPIAQRSLRQRRREISS